MATHPTIVLPAGQTAHTYLTAQPDPSLPRGFLDAMIVRKEVFVREQGCSLDLEVDDDDARSYHWVLYASVKQSSSSSGDSSEGTDGAAAAASANNRDPAEFDRRFAAGGQVPVGTIRMVPPPHAPHPNPGSVDGKGGTDVSERRVPGGDRPTKFHDGRELYVKFGRMATVKAFRGMGLGRQMISAGLDWAAAHAREIEGALVPADPVEKEKVLVNVGSRDEVEWRGLVMLHAQVSAVPFYAGLGFETDDELGTWVEEGIDHVAMWKRLVLKGADAGK